MSAPQPVTLITGATEGIGRALAREFARTGHDLLLIARTEAALLELSDKLSATYSISTHICALDLSKRGQRQDILKILNQENIYVDVLVNNAAIGLCGGFIDHDGNDLNRLVDLNISALTELCHMFLPAMVEKKRGGILNVASLGGLIPGPYQAAYYASKAYVISLTEALAHETAGTSVRISVVVPGPVDTEFHQKMGAGHALYLRAFGVMDPDKVARAAIRGFNWNRTFIAPGLFNTFATIALRLIPHTIMTPIFGWLLKPRRKGDRNS